MSMPQALKYGQLAVSWNIGIYGRLSLVYFSFLDNPNPNT